MKKYYSILLVAALFVTLFTVSCSKKDDTPASTPKVFSMTTSFSLAFNAGTFSGTFTNADNLTALTLMLKRGTDDYQQYEIDFNKNGFSHAINDLAFDSFTYHYEYVVDGATKQTDEQSFKVLVGRWSTADGGHCEVYNADGTGHMWDPADDVNEDEADDFDWQILEGTNQMVQTVYFQGGQSEIPQYCNILNLDATHFHYNNEGWRAEYNLIRAE